MHITVSALYFLYILFQECCMSLGSCMLQYVMLLCYGLIVLHFEYAKINYKDQGVWVCLAEHARFQNAA